MLSDSMVDFDYLVNFYIYFSLSQDRLLCTSNIVLIIQIYSELEVAHTSELLVPLFIMN
jgi:hypothetical protein